MLNRIPKSWILLAVFVVSIMTAGAWVYTTPPDYITNQTGDWFGNTSNNGNNYTADRFDVMNYFGAVVGTYLDSYSCGASYCIYNPWYASGRTYAKNVSTGKIDFSGTLPSEVAKSVINYKVSDFTMYFAPGVYNDFSVLLTTNNKNITLKSSGYKAAVLRANATQTTPVVNISCDTAIACSGNTIEDFYIDVQSTHVDAIAINIGRQNNVVHNYITNSPFTSINVTGTGAQNPYETRVERNTVDNPSGYANVAPHAGIMFDANSHDGYITDNVVDHYQTFGSACINISGSSHEIRGNHVWGCDRGINSGGSMTRIYGNFLDSTNYQGVYIWGGTLTSVFGNVFLANNESHLNNYSMNISTAASAITVFGNIVYNYGTSSVSYFLGDQSGNSIVSFGNTARGTGGVSTLDLPGGLFVVGNKINPRAGDNFYNSTSKAFNIWNGATWQYQNGTYVNSY